MGLLDNRAAKKAINLVGKQTPEEQANILDGLEKQMKNLTKKQRKRAEKLLGLFNKGQVLKANKDIDNKKLILERE